MAAVEVGTAAWFEIVIIKVTGDCQFSSDGGCHCCCS